MKSLILLLFVSTFGSIPMFSQTNYPVIDTVKGKNAVYYRIQTDEYQIPARNIRDLNIIEIPPKDIPETFGGKYIHY